MKKINELLEIGYCQHGYVIPAKNLQKWAYNQLAAAPNLLEACKVAKGLLEGLAQANIYKLGNVYNDLAEAISKAEGRE